MANCNACHDTGLIPMIIPANRRAAVGGEKVCKIFCPVCKAGELIKTFNIHFTGIKKEG